MDRAGESSMMPVASPASATLMEPKNDFSSQDIPKITQELQAMGRTAAASVKAMADEQFKILLHTATGARRYLRHRIIKSIKGEQKCTDEEVKSLGDLQSAMADFEFTIFTRTLGTLLEIDEGKDAEQVLSTTLKACLKDLEKPSGTRLIFVEKKQPITPILKWEKVGHEKPQTGSEITNEALPTALKSKTEEIILDFKGLWRALHLSMRTSLAFDRLDTGSDRTITREEFENVSFDAGIPSDESELRFKIIDTDCSGDISESEFFGSSAGSVANILELIVQATWRHDQWLQRHDQWLQLLKVLCIMEGRGRMLAFSEVLISAAPPSLVNAVLSKMGFANGVPADTDREMRKVVAEMIKTLSPKELEQSLKNSASAWQTLVEASQELAEKGFKDVCASVREHFILRVLSALHISGGEAKDDLKEQVRKLLLDETLFETMARSPDKLVLQGIKMVAAKNQDLFRRIGQTFCEEEVKKWLKCLQQTSDMECMQQTSDVAIQDIVLAVMRVFDTEMAGLLLGSSLDKMDLRNVLMVCIRVIHAIFQQDESLVEGVLKQVTVFVLLRLGMEKDRANFVAKAIPWHMIKVTLKDDFNQQRRPPLNFVMQRAVEILSSVVKQGAENKALQKGAEEAVKAFLKYLRSEVEKILTSWGVRSPSSAQSPSVLPRSPRVVGIEVTIEEREQLITVVTDHISTLLSSKWDMIVNIVDDPMSAPEVFLKAMDSKCLVEETRNVLQKILTHIVRGILRDKLVKQGIDEEDAEQLLQLLEKQLNLTEGFSAPQSAVQKMVALYDKLLQGKDGEGNADVGLVLRCVRALAVHYLQELLTKRGYDNRALEIAEVVIENMPTEKLSAAMMTKEPQELLQQVLHQGVQAGFDFAQEMLEGCTEDLQETIRSTLMTRTGLTGEQLDIMVETVAGGFEDLEDEEDVLGAAADIVENRGSVSEMAGGGILALLWFVRERFLLTFDTASDVYVAFLMCEPERLGGECGYGRYSNSTHSNSTHSNSTFAATPEQVEARRVFFVLAVFFICLNWSVLWLAVFRHFVREYVVDIRRIVPQGSVNLLVRWVFLPGCFFLLYLIIVLPTMVFGAVLLLPAFSWYGAKLLLHQVCPSFVSRPTLPSSDLGWRMHCGAEVTESSTNKQHHLNPDSSQAKSTPGAAYKRGAEVTTLVFTAATLPLGATALAAVEVYTQLFSSTEPLQDPFWSAYENARRVIEPLLEALPQALLQVAYTLWLWRTGQQSLGDDFYVTLASIAASVTQTYKIYHYLADLRVAYRLSWWDVVRDLLSLGSHSQAPFRFVLRSWTCVDYSLLLDNALGDEPKDVNIVSQIAEALVNNTSLKRLKFGTHQLSPERIKVFATAFRANTHLQEFEVVDTHGMATAGGKMAKVGLSGEDVICILQAAPHLLSVRIAGVQRRSSHWADLAATLQPMRLESFSITYRTLDDDAAKPTQENLGKQTAAAAAAVAKVLAGMRTLRAIKLSGLPCGLLGLILRSGLCSSRTISAVDLSFNAVEPSAVKALTAWVLKGIVTELVLEGIVLTSSDREPRKKHRTGIGGLYDLVKILGAPRSRLQVCVMTLAHPLQSKQGAGAREAVAGAVSNKDLKRLTTTCSTAGSSTRTGRFFCVGLHDADASGTRLNAHQRGTFEEVGRKVMRVMRGLLRQLLPCFATADNQLESVTASLEMQDFGKSGVEHTISRCCRRLCAAKAARVVYVMLQQVPDDFALDVRVLLMDLLDLVSKADTSEKNVTAEIGNQNLVSKADTSEKNVTAEIGNQYSVRLASCGISGANIEFWLPLLTRCPQLSLADSKLEQPEMDKMRLYLQRGGFGGCFSWWGAAKSEVRLKVLDFASTNPLTPDVAMTLLQMAHDVEHEIECKFGPRSEYRFSRTSLQPIISKAVRVDDIDCRDMQQVADKALLTKFFSRNMQPVLNRSGDNWKLLRDAWIHLQNRQSSSMAADMQSIFECAGREPALVRAYFVLLQLRPHDVSEAKQIILK